ncbi:MAG: Holliday junction resolvase [Thermoplasmata archaeon]|nr:MAG: Holliday junction resolvase [Thermoplasmata archaeon]RLF50644.1 MAG: Holliday junction resolvase [Thermoplasmata archaeon]
MNASQYERELKGILEGEVKILSKITKTCSALEKSNYFKITSKPFAVIRAAGSLGVDLVATRGDISFLTEVKTSNNSVLHFSSMAGKLQRQAETMKRICEKTKTLPVYAFRSKGTHGDSWRVFTLDLEGLEGRTSVLHKRLPKLRRSKNGNFIMKWDEGMPLSDFISYLCR